MSPTILIPARTTRLIRSMLVVIWAAISVGVDCPTIMADDSALMKEASANIEARFRELDSDENGRLTLVEFLAFDNDEALLRRDFLVYDFNHDQQLSRAEFSAVPGLTEDWLRGSVPDPFDGLLEDAVAALDESYDQWQKRPNEFVNAHSFVANFIGSISPEGKRFVTGRILRQADKDSDGRLSRTEARGFLEHQLGIRWHDDSQLREKTGRVLRLGAFIAADQDRNDVLSSVEFDRGHWSNDQEHAFEKMDQNSDRRITLREYSHYRLSSSFFDPIVWFRLADLDLDAKLSRSEIAVLVDEANRHLVSSTVPAFDLDGDGLLGLQEYRLSMIANVNYPWHRQPQDTNRDGYLSYDEFVFFGLDLFQLQRRYYFHRLDRDQDGKLSIEEFEFRTDKPNAIYIYSDDGRRLVYQDDRYPQLGNVSASADGKKILFERRRAIGAEESQIALTDIAGSKPIAICDGSNPSWGRDGSQFVCERSTGSGTQIWLMSADGRSGHPIAFGRSPKWSPDGASIAFLQDCGVRLFDARSGQVRSLLERHQHDCSDLGSSVVWSPESSRVAVLGSTENSRVLFSISATESNTTEKAHQKILLSADSLDIRAKTRLLLWTLEGIVLGIGQEPNSEEGDDNTTRDGSAIVADPSPSVDGWQAWDSQANVGTLISACSIPGSPWYTTIVDF